MLLLSDVTDTRNPNEGTDAKNDLNGSCPVLFLATCNCVSPENEAVLCVSPWCTGRFDDAHKELLGLNSGLATRDNQSSCLSF